MERIQHELVQGSPEWHQFRLEHDGASEAPAMLGLDDDKPRNQLLHEKATGIAKEVDANTQRIFDKGHATEAAARPIADKLIGDELYPQVWSYGRLSASTDGMTMEGSIIWQHKQLNAALATAVAAGELPDKPMAQVQQEMHVTGAGRCLFMVSDGTEENCESMWVTPDPAWVKRIEAGWAQFNIDRANYKPPEVLPPVTAAPVMALPALSIQVNGAITLTDNLAVFGEKLTAFIDRLPAKPETDQQFADCEQAIKTLETAQNALEAAESSALAQVASVDEMRRTVALYAGQARSTRLMLTKLVAARKEQIRVEIVQAGKDKLAEHVTMLNKRLGRPYMPLIAENLGGVIKGKKTVTSLRDAVDSEVARVKIELNATADRIQINLTSLIDLAGEHKFLFADTAQLVMKENDDLVNLIKLRIAEHKAAEAKRLEAEREKIRQEEQAKAETEARAKVEAEQREQREQADAKARQEREDQAVEDKRIAVELAEMEAKLQADRAEVAKAHQAEADRVAAVQARLDAAVPVDPILDRAGLIRSFMAGKKYPAKKMNETVALLHEFCEFLDKFKQERKAA